MANVLLSDAEKTFILHGVEVNLMGYIISQLIYFIKINS